MAGYRPRSEEERRFLESYDPSRFDRPSVTVDTVALRRGGSGLEVLLIRRRGFPYAGAWALPGGFLDLEADDDLQAGALRELAEETGLEAARLEQIGSFGRKGRDPRTRTVTVAFLALLSGEQPVAGADDAAEAGWFAVEPGPEGTVVACRGGEPVELAFDHADLLAAGCRELASRAEAAASLLRLADPAWSAAELAGLLEGARRLRR